VNRSKALKPPKLPENELSSVDADDGFRRFVGMSVGLHLTLLALLTIKAVFYPAEPIQPERAIRVDMVGLPDKIKNLPPPLKEPLKEDAKPDPVKQETAKPEPPKPKKIAMPDKPAKPEPDKVNLEKTKQAQDSALKRLEALKKIESMMKDEAPKAAAKNAFAKPAVVKGNEVSPGSALTGIARLENDSYLTTLDEHVKKYWDLPNFLANARLSASVVVFVDERGHVLKKQLVRSSGNQIFDQTVLTSIERASPFPPPPRRLANLFMVDGIQLGFPD
jgi:TonB family protein